MDYFASTSLSNLKKMIDTEKDATIRQKFLVVWHKKAEKTEKEINEILLAPKSTVGYLVRKFRKDGPVGI